MKRTFFLKKICITKLPFQFHSSRRQIPQWPSREHYDPVNSVCNSPTSKASPRLLHQQSLEKTHQKSYHGSPQTTSNAKGATENLFELLERCSQRLDDQRCVLPSYFSQVSKEEIMFNIKLPLKTIQNPLNTSTSS